MLGLIAEHRNVIFLSFSVILRIKVLYIQATLQALEADGE